MAKNRQDVEDCIEVATKENAFEFITADEKPFLYYQKHWQIVLVK